MIMIDVYVTLTTTTFSIFGLYWSEDIVELQVYVYNNDNDNDNDNNVILE